MISQIGKVSLENMKQIEIIRKKEVEGKEEEVKESINVRFDFAIPMGVAYDTALEVLDEFKEEVKKMQEMALKRAEELKNKEQKEEV